MARELRPIPTSAGQSCPQCADGWTCEKHPGIKWPHKDETDATGECAGPGMPCLNGCMWLNNPKPEDNDAE